MRKAERNLRGRDTGVPPPPPPPLLSPPRLRRSAAGNAALAVAANAAAAAAAKAPSWRVHGVSPGGCSGSPGTAPSSARPPAARSTRSSPSAAGPPPPPASAQPSARQLARAFVRSCARAPAHPPSPRLTRRALPPPRPRPAGSRGRLGSLLPRPLPSCRVCRKQKAGGWPRSRAQGMRAGAAGPAHWGRWGASRWAGAWRGLSVEGAARVGSAAAGHSWRARAWKPPEDPACLRADACGPLFPGHSARAPHLLLGTLAPGSPTPGRPEAAFSGNPQPPRVFSLGDLRCEGGCSEKGHKGGVPGRGARLEATELGAGAKARAFAPPGRSRSTNRQSWKLFPHVAPQALELIYTDQKDTDGPLSAASRILFSFCPGT
uniref:uncharacterized protein LOC118151641 n=1 Tax=Callithrix jacchus TaxID=9483 RepID=UPI0023DD4C5F|nr:uncharacterized protein LOC118151641 [Callithrix jacchus]XP_035147875.2 uncharacterized protein LOC118151641 [Callithrix jacchus]